MPEANIIVPDNKISVYGSSCNYLFLGTIHGICPSWMPRARIGCQQIERQAGARIRPKHLYGIIT